MNDRKEIIDWLLGGDVSIQYQTQRDLLHANKNTLDKLKSRISTKGWGYEYLLKQNGNGHWGLSFYQPKWTSTHYTLLELRCLEINKIQSILDIVDSIIENQKGYDGGINPSGTINESDVCINGMFLNYASYFGVSEEKIISIIDYIISQQMKDGGFNCRLSRSGAVHSSLHSTLSCLEGISEYIANEYTYQMDELRVIECQAIEFILQHKLYKSDHTDEIIHKSFTMLSYPSRWRYDILRALDYFRKIQLPYDPRMQDALDLLLKKQRKDNTWNVQAKHVGAVYFDMEKTGKQSRWNTLRAMRVLEYYCS